MAFDPERQSQPAANGLASIQSDANGVHGTVYASVNNFPQGHLEIHAPNVEAVKLLMQTLGQWVVQNTSTILMPNGKA